MPQPFCLSIETDAGAYVDGFHLGTDERLARQLCEEAFHKRIPKQGSHIRTVALMRGRSPLDFFDGTWSSDDDFEMEE
jgi:hypothetical protein